MTTTNPNAYPTDDYTQPIDAPTGGRPGWIPSSPLADTLFGKGYVNEGDPTWEEVIHKLLCCVVQVDVDRHVDRLDLDGRDVDARGAAGREHGGGDGCCCEDQMSHR